MEPAVAAGDDGEIPVRVGANVECDELAVRGLGTADRELDLDAGLQRGGVDEIAKRADGGLALILRDALADEQTVERVAPAERHGAARDDVAACRGIEDGGVDVGLVARGNARGRDAQCAERVGLRGRNTEKEGCRAENSAEDGQQVAVFLLLDHARISPADDGGPLPRPALGQLL
jgi:hypothetical protein